MYGNGLEAEPITAAESTRHSWDLEQTREAREHDIKTRQMELAVLKQQNSLSTLFKIPLTIIKLPVYLLLAVGFIVAMIRGIEPGESFWDLLR